MDPAPTPEPVDRPTMDRAAFLAWEAAQPGDTKWERKAGRPVAMGGGSFLHARTKFRVALALHGAIGAAGLRCETLIDDLKVPVDSSRDYIPDVAVRCGSAVDDPARTRLLTDPIIVVEVISQEEDDPAWAKVANYLLVPSIRQVLIIDPFRRLVVRTEGAEGGWRAWVHRPPETLRLDPPGLSVVVADLLAAA